MLDNWLTERAKVKVTDIQLGLERCAEVAAKLRLIDWDIPVIVVGGTNGKGSTLAVLQAIYHQNGYRTMLYTSPHIRHFNERIQLQCKPVKDAVFIQAVEQIEAIKGEIELTFFEWSTLAALLIAKQSSLDVLLLEVGMGGRLDAVNVVESDLAIITSIAMDHMEYLGDTRESIAREKAGIIRPGHAVVCGDCDMPAAIAAHADLLQAPLSQIGVDFDLQETELGWLWHNREGLSLRGAQSLQLKPSNVATALQACALMQAQLPVSNEIMQSAVDGLSLAGRYQWDRMAGYEWVFDVAHNPQAVEYLAQRLLKNPASGNTWALFSALGSKDVVNMVKPMLGVVDYWLVPQLNDCRAAPEGWLENVISCALAVTVNSFVDTTAAVSYFLQQARLGDRCIVFGSFVTVGAVQADRERLINESFV